MMQDGGRGNFAFEVRRFILAICGFLNEIKLPKAWAIQSWICTPQLLHKIDCFGLCNGLDEGVILRGFC